LVQRLCRLDFRQTGTSILRALRKIHRSICIDLGSTSGLVGLGRPSEPKTRSDRSLGYFAFPGETRNSATLHVALCGFPAPSVAGVPGRAKVFTGAATLLTVFLLCPFFFPLFFFVARVGELLQRAGPLWSRLPKRVQNALRSLSRLLCIDHFAGCFGARILHFFGFLCFSARNLTPWDIFCFFGSYPEINPLELCVPVWRASVCAARPV